MCKIAHISDVVRKADDMLGAAKRESFEWVNNDSKAPFHSIRLAHVISVITAFVGTVEAICRQMEEGDFFETVENLVGKAWEVSSYLMEIVEDYGGSKELSEEVFDGLYREGFEVYTLRFLKRCMEGEDFMEIPRLMLEYRSPVSGVPEYDVRRVYEASRKIGCSLRDVRKCVDILFPNIG